MYPVITNFVKGLKWQEKKKKRINTKTTSPNRQMLRWSSNSVPFMDSKVHYHIHKSLSLATILCHMDLIHSYIKIKIHFNITSHLYAKHKTSQPTG
jgi:hypothetical protein